MADTPEAKVKRWLRDKMKEWYPDSWHYPCPGGPFGIIGAPDDIWIIRGVFVAIESKSDAKQSPTQAQWHNLMKIKANGGVVAVMKGKDISKLLLIRQMIEDRVKAIP